MARAQKSPSGSRPARSARSMKATHWAAWVEVMPGTSFQLAGGGSRRSPGFDTRRSTSALPHAVPTPRHVLQPYVGLVRDCCQPRDPPHQLRPGLIVLRHERGGHADQRGRRSQPAATLAAEGITVPLPSGEAPSGTGPGSASVPAVGQTACGRLGTPSGQDQDRAGEDQLIEPGRIDCGQRGHTRHRPSPGRPQRPVPAVATARHDGSRLSFHRPVASLRRSPVRLRCHTPVGESAHRAARWVGRRGGTHERRVAASLRRQYRSGAPHRCRRGARSRAVVAPGSA